MDEPDISSLRIRDTPHSAPISTPTVPEDIENAGDDRYMRKLRAYAHSLPYTIESYGRGQELLDLILTRICQCLEAKDYELGFMQWDSMLTTWFTLKYPLPKDKRISLCKIYFHLATTPGMTNLVAATAADGLQALTRSKKKLTLEDFRLPWKPMYEMLRNDLFLKRRQYEYTQLSWNIGYVADVARRFFHPASINEMLSCFLPLMNGTELDTILASQFYLLTFLPLSHPQYYLPMLFRVWESINSWMFDDRMLHFLYLLTEMHVDPTVSDPRRISRIPDDERSEGEDRPSWAASEAPYSGPWLGLYKDVGLFTEHEWHMLMCKCLASMEIPLADAGSLTTGPSADRQAAFEIGRLPKPNWRIYSLSRIIVYSMALDGVPASSFAPTPFMTPLSSGTSTPQIQTSTLAEFLAAPLGKRDSTKPQTFLAGSKALDSLARLIMSTESFFHPTNSGPWTNDLSAFIKYIVYDFNKRWHEEQKPDCKTPMNRRLTRQMKRELIKSLRTVVLLAMFSSDATTVSNIQSCMKSMSAMEPDLILHPILDRAVPALEALVETDRTLAVIKALGAVAPALVSRSVYYAGSKHLVPVLQLLIPGIDLNDPTKTLFTASFLSEVAQYIKFGDLTSETEADDISDQAAQESGSAIPSLSFSVLDDFELGAELRLSDKEEDAALRESTGGFADWVASFIRRVILLLENLPEEGPDGRAGGASEVQVIDAVAGACNQICSHLSKPLYELVLNMVFDYASTNVRSNAVRAVHQLVEAVANADPVRTLEKFFSFCVRNIEVELENGASSLRTTSSSTPLPSDATLHWNLAILRGTVFNDGRALLKYASELLALFSLLREKTYSKRGYSWTGKLLSSTLLTLTHTYPLENKFVNPSEWNSEEFDKNHHRSWGKLYAPDDVEISWHVPNSDEITFALKIFEQLVEPTLARLEGLLLDDVVRNEVWRNDFCRYLTLVRYAFAGVPTLWKEHLSDEQRESVLRTSDVIGEIPEMIAIVEPISSGFCLTDPSEVRYQYIYGLRARFGRFLHNASSSLNRQGEENTVDAVRLVVNSIRTFFLEYGDSRDSYWTNSDQYNQELNVARLEATQKVWPRAIFVRRARFLHSARLRWNSLERKRGAIENNLIDDVVEWSIWHYATIRESAQSLLESLCYVHDGIRRRAMPMLYKALAPGTEDDRMKGALWALNCQVFTKYASADPTLYMEFLDLLFKCQHNEKPSIQACVTAVSENFLNTFQEPSYTVYDIDTPFLDRSVEDLQALLRSAQHGKDPLMLKCRDNRVKRLKEINIALADTTSSLLNVAKLPSTHWRYCLVAIRALRNLLRRDVPMTSDHLRYFVETTYASHPSMRYYAIRGVMKALRNIKLRSICRSQSDLVQGIARNPLKRQVAVKKTSSFSEDLLHSFTESVDLESLERAPLFLDRTPPGWLVLGQSVDLYQLPPGEASALRPWEASSQHCVEVVRELATKVSFWEDLSGYFAEENQESGVVQDNVACVKSIFQILEDEPLEIMKPTLEKLLDNSEKDKQRAAAELLAGLIGGSKHWPVVAQKRLWSWFKPYISKIFANGASIKTETLGVWNSFIQYVFYHRDPRRVKVLFDYIIQQFTTMDYNTESSFDAIKPLFLFRSVYEGLGWKFVPWVDQSVERCWRELDSEHDDVRAYVSEVLAFSGKMKWRPKPSLPDAQVFVLECQTATLDSNIMSMRGTYHADRVQELVQNFRMWKEQRIPGVRAFQSTYDKVGVTVCKWLYQVVHDIQAISVFDYFLPLMPELFRFTELNDNDELASRAETLLVRMCGVTPPRALIDPILGQIFEAVRKSPSWRVRLKALPLVQVFYFRQMPMISEAKTVEILEMLCSCLDDEVVEVREMAASTLSGIIRLSPRRSVMTLKDRFVRLAKSSKIPSRQAPTYAMAIRQRHAAILGVCALVDSYPYTIEKWMPSLMTEVLAEHTYDPIPISTTVRKCASTFKKTHQDTWHEDAKHFNDDQLAALSTLLTGSSYYA